MGVGAGLYMCDVVKKFTFAISSPDEFLLYHMKGQSVNIIGVFQAIFFIQGPRYTSGGPRYTSGGPQYTPGPWCTPGSRYA